MLIDVQLIYNAPKKVSFRPERGPEFPQNDKNPFVILRKSWTSFGWKLTFWALYNLLQKKYNFVVFLLTKSVHVAGILKKGNTISIELKKAHRNTTICLAKQTKLVLATKVSS